MRRGKRSLAALALLLLLALGCGCASAETFEAYGLTLSSEDTALNLGKTKVTDFDELREVLRRMPNLEQADMYETRMEKDVMASLAAEFPQIRFGWTLRVGKYRVRTDATAFSTLRQPDEKPRYSSESYDALRYCYQIQGVDLGHNQITDVGFLSGLTELRYLILADNDIEDLTPLESLQKLEYLELFMNEITDLTPLTKLPNLIDLNLAQMRLTDLTPLYEMKQLRRLYLARNNPPITEEQREALRQALPDCDINFDASSCTVGGWRKHPRFQAVKNTFRKQSFIPWTDEERNDNRSYMEN
ncbi:MAG: leucine-rich repeat domain-containing protein [Clostridia bacterium]|nr:leucine-rich repeat domain-containing protein [Clostridia bacterium]